MRRTETIARRVAQAEQRAAGRVADVDGRRARRFLALVTDADLDTLTALATGARPWAALDAATAARLNALWLAAG